LILIYNVTSIIITSDRSPVVSLGIFPVAVDSSMCRGVDSASKNEYQDTPGGKGGPWVRLTTYHLMPLSRNMGTLTSWNPLGLSRPVTGQLYNYNFVIYFIAE
jgi:hypothetical protein